MFFFLFLTSKLCCYKYTYFFMNEMGEGEEQNREEGEMAQKKLGGGRNRGKK